LIKVLNFSYAGIIPDLILSIYENPDDYCKFMSKIIEKGVSSSGPERSSGT